MIFAEEKMSSRLFDEISPLLEKHYKEIAAYQDIALDVDWDAYKTLGDKGAIKVFTARVGEERKLVGYSVYFLRHNMHYKNSFQAVQDVLFVQKEYRGRGGAFIKWCDEELKKLSVQVVYHHVKEKHNFGPMLERIGYELVDLIYARRLD